MVLVAYGSPARICRTVVDLARGEGMKIGLLRPITLFPFPKPQLIKMARSGKCFMVVEMSHGQMVEDVRLAVNGVTDVAFYGRSGGVVPTPTEILNQVRASFNKPPVVSHYSKKIDSARTEASR
jgi:2-oxoglutarate ferredoxin oxidoreductase subunit alpha